jgi:hypothetical protein
MTSDAVAIDHFDGHRNLTQAQRREAQAILAELLGAATLAPTMTPAAEAADVIAVALATGVLAADQYVAEVIDTNSEVNDAAFTIAETGAGAEVSPTAKARLIFTTDALGVAELSVTDVVGASGSTVYLMVRPLTAAGASALQPAAGVVALTFD